MLGHSLSNCTYKDGAVDVTFPKPFDILVQNLPREELAGAGFSAKTPKGRKWLRFVDEVRTALVQESTQIGLLLQSYRMISEEIANGRTAGMR